MGLPNTRCYCLGIDPSLNSTGLAVLTAENGKITHRRTDVIKHTSLTGLERLQDTRDRMLAFFSEHLGPTPNVVTICLEGASHASTGRHDELGKNRGILLLALYEAFKVKPIEIPPARVKKFGARTGGATKKAMIAAARLRGWDIALDADDEADAAHLADLAAALQGILPPMLTRQQLEVLRDMATMIVLKPKKHKGVYHASTRSKKKIFLC